MWQFAAGQYKHDGRSLVFPRAVPIDADCRRNPPSPKGKNDQPTELLTGPTRRRWSDRPTEKTARLRRQACTWRSLAARAGQPTHRDGAHGPASAHWRRNATRCASGTRCSVDANAFSLRQCRFLFSGSRLLYVSPSQSVRRPYRSWHANDRRRWWPVHLNRLSAHRLTTHEVR